MLFIFQMIWSRRDPRPHMNSICSNAGDSSIADEVSEIMNSLRYVNVISILVLIMGVACVGMRYNLWRAQVFVMGVREAHAHFPHKPKLRRVY